MVIDLDWRRIEIPGLAGATIQVRPLTWDAYQQVLGVFAPDGEAPKGGVGPIIERLSNPEIAEILKVLLPEFCRDLQGVRIRHEGRETEATITDLLGHSLFLPACLTLALQLFTISTFSDNAGN